ncbi:hypothetical protein KI387_036439, partial [Taxus chinensis]
SFQWFLVRTTTCPMGFQVAQRGDFQSSDQFSGLLMTPCPMDCFRLLIIHLA